MRKIVSPDERNDILALDIVNIFRTLEINPGCPGNPRIRELALDMLEVAGITSEDLENVYDHLHPAIVRARDMLQKRQDRIDREVEKISRRCEAAAQ